jgi:ATP-dependent Clp protease ATP-binding subunit ClpB
MSEFMEKHSVARLIGAPPGYVGYEEGGYLTEAVRRKPYSVLLLDEVEKAHPDVFNILLQVLDDGRLTDGQGRTVDFKNTVIVMTSNLGSHLIQAMVGRPAEDIKDAVWDELKTHFRPEFLNRLDGMITFEPLDRAQLTKVADIQIAALQERLEDRRITLELSEDAKLWLVNKGFDPAYGARPLRRLVQTAIGDKLAKVILSGEAHDGDTVHIDVAGNGAPLPAGDFVRWCRQVLDLLDQVRNAAPEAGVRRAAKRAIDDIRRGVVAVDSG